MVSIHKVHIYQLHLPSQKQLDELLLLIHLGLMTQIIGNHITQTFTEDIK